MFLPYEQRQATALALLERGYEERIFISADSCGTIDWFPQAVIEQMLAAGMAKDWDIRIVPERVIPDLRERGMTDAQVEQVLVKNPVGWLTG
jgi:phosphotriesterase-related protein